MNIEEFLNEDGESPYVRKLLLLTIKELKDCRDCKREFAFNRFNIELDSATNTALIEDDLDASASGRIVLSLEDFEAALMRASN